MIELAKFTRPVKRIAAPTDTAATAGIWSGLVVGDTGKHRGAHAAVLRDDGCPLCLCGPATDPKSAADARLLAHLWNTARAAGATFNAIN